MAQNAGVSKKTLFEYDVARKYFERRGEFGIVDDAELAKQIRAMYLLETTGAKEAFLKEDTLRLSQKQKERFR